MERVKAKRLFWSIVVLALTVLTVLEWRATAYLLGAVATLCALAGTVWLFGEAYDTDEDRTGW